MMSFIPWYYLESVVMNELIDASGIEFDNVRDVIDDILNQFFVATATWGLDSWEEFLGITTDTSKTIDARRQAIIQKINGSQTATLDFMTRLVNRYIDDKSGIVVDHPETYSIEIDIPLIDKEHLKEIIQDVNTYIPAHIGPYYGEIEKKLVQHNIAITRATIKTVEIYPAALEKVSPESSLYIGMAMSMTEELTLTIGGI